MHNPPRTISSTVVVVATALLALPALLAGGQTIYTANFDEFAEGSLGTSFTSGGITFSALDQRFPGDNFAGNFIADEATGNLPAPFSAPNALGFGGYQDGPYGSFARFGSAAVTFNGIASSASMDVFSSILPSANVLTLEAWSGGGLVSSSSVSFAPSFSHQVLNVTAPGFDHLRLVASGPEADGVVFILLDNVTVQVVPEPAALHIGTMGAIALCIARSIRRIRSR